MTTLIRSNLILFSCGLVPVSIISVLSEFNSSLSSFIHLLILAMDLAIALPPLGPPPNLLGMTGITAYHLHRPVRLASET